MGVDRSSSFSRARASPVASMTPHENVRFPEVPANGTHSAHAQHFVSQGRIRPADLVRDRKLRGNPRDGSPVILERRRSLGGFAFPVGREGEPSSTSDLDRAFHGHTSPSRRSPFHDRRVRALSVDINTSPARTKGAFCSRNALTPTPHTSYSPSRRPSMTKMRCERTDSLTKLLGWSESPKKTRFDANSPLPDGESPSKSLASGSCRSKASSSSLSLSTAAPTESGEEASPEEGTTGEKRQKEGSAERSRSVGMSTRMNRLSKPKPIVHVQPPVVEIPPKKVMATRSIRPSILVRVRPVNVEEAMDRFFEDPTVAPIFQYTGSPETVRKAFTTRSTVDFSLVEVAKNVLNLIMTDHNGADAYMTKTYSGARVDCQEMVSRVRQYLEDLNLEDKVEIRTSPNMMSAANVVKPSPDGKYIVNLTQHAVSEPMVKSICDHEIGTHLLRMLNDEHQAWHCCRSHYNLRDPWVTEEGLATINTYRSMQGDKIMYPQALKYYATCRAAHLGFCELFVELEPYMPDPKRRFRMCCRVKRGLVDTSEPGAFNIDQAYFKGAVDILRNLNAVDFGRLYSGQVALEDLDKVHFLIRKEVLRLPKFLNSEERFRKYIKHCKEMIVHNMLEVNSPGEKKTMFARAAKHLFFKSNCDRAPRNAYGLDVDKRIMSYTLPSLNMIRLDALSKPKTVIVPENESSPAVRRSVDPQWLTEISKPSQRAHSMPKMAPAKVEKGKAVALQELLDRRLDFLSIPKNPSTIEKKDDDALSVKTTKKLVKRLRSTGPTTLARPQAPQRPVTQTKPPSTRSRERTRSPAMPSRESGCSASRATAPGDNKEGPEDTASAAASSSGTFASIRTRSKQPPSRQELRMGVCVPVLQLND
eukprot:GEMP01003028.1.p1 GENE.GEMP01003028.1~~GEMP01003028.1.p1  ORF type:complete len:873 (+),score=169.69 GEMP01003028.1:1594-4212(+)